MVNPTPSLDGLIVLLPAEAGHAWHWWRVRESGVGAMQAFDAEAEAAPWGDVGEVTVLVDTDACTLTLQGHRDIIQLLLPSQKRPQRE